MDWGSEREKLREQFKEQPQRQALADLALMGAKSAVDELAKLGLIYDLVDAAPKAPVKVEVKPKVEEVKGETKPEPAKTEPAIGGK